MQYILTISKTKTAKTIGLGLVAALVVVSIGLVTASDQTPVVNHDFIVNAGSHCWESRLNPANSNSFVWVDRMTNRGPGSIRVSTEIYHSNNAGCDITSEGTNVAAFSISGKTEYAEGETGETTLTYNTRAFDCGRTQIDGVFHDQNGNKTTFLGIVINYGADCASPPAATGKIRVINREVNTGKDIFACWTLVRQEPTNQRWEGQCAVDHTYNNFVFGKYTIEVNQNGTTHDFDTVDPIGPQVLSNGTPGGVIQWIVYWKPKQVSGGQNFTLTVNKAGNGSGTVTGPGVNCGSDCTETYTAGTYIELKAAADSGSRFDGWSQACTHQVNCIIVMDSNKSVTATFNIVGTQIFTLTVSKIGNGSGTVTGLGINCGSDCIETYAASSVIELKAVADAGSVFAGWSQDCTHPQNCIVVMNGNRAVTATFNKQNFILTVNKAGNGSGTATGLGINCGSDCTETYQAGSVIELKAVADSGSVFDGWSQACTHQVNCIIVMDSNKSVTATFNIVGTQIFTLTVSKIGNGSGTVTGSGIDCGSVCSRTYAAGAGVTLTDNPDSGSSFGGWSGDCSGSNCSLTMNANKNVVAAFNKLAAASTPSVNITKTVRNISQNQTNFVNATSANPGEEVEFRIQVSASGGNITSVSVNDDIRSSSLSYISGTLRIDGNTDAGSITSIGLGIINNGSTKTVTLRARVAASGLPEGANTLVNLATVNSSAGSRSSSAEVGVNIARSSSPTPGTVNVNKLVRNVSANQTSFSATTTANPGEQVEFQLRVEVSGGTVNNIVLSDSLPFRLSYVSDSLRIDGAAAGNNLSSINVGSMTNQIKTVTLRANVADISQFSIGSSSLFNRVNLTSSVANRSDSATVIVTVNSPSQLSCSPSFQTATTNQLVSLFASGGYGNGIYSWSAPEGSPLSGSGNSLSVRFATSGVKTVILSNSIAGSSLPTLTTACNVSVLSVTNVPSVNLNIDKQVRNVSTNSGFVDSISITPGQQVEFRLTVTNTGNTDANNVVVTDIMPSNFNLNFVTLDSGVSQGSNQTTFNFSSINAGSSKTARITATANSDSSFPVGTSSWVNVASTSSSNASTVTDNASVIVTREFVAQQQVSLSVDKQVRNITTNSGFGESVSANSLEQVEFRITVTVSGTTTANNVNVTDSLPANFNFNSANVDSGVTQISNTSFNLGNLSPGSSRTIRITAQTASESNFSFGSSNWVNTAIATSSNFVSASDSASVNVNRGGGGGVVNTSLSAVKQVRNLTTGSGFAGSSSARANDRLEFRIEIRNQGSVTALNARVFDSFPSGLNFASGTVRVDGSSSFSGDLFSNNLFLGSLFPGNTKVITFEANVPSTNFATTVTNSATVFADNASSVTSNASVNIQGVVAGSNVDLALSKRAFNQTKNQNATLVTANSGDVIIYTLTVDNRGNATANNFVIEDELFDALQLAELLDFGDASFNLAQHKLTWPAVTVFAGGRIEKTFSVRVRNQNLGTDSIMTNIYGNRLDINVALPVVAGKYIAPKTGATSTVSLVLSSLVLGIFAFFRRDKKHFVREL